MKFENIGSLPGSPEPADIFEPHMPGVDVLSDMASFFIKVRELLVAESTDNFAQKAGLGLLAPPENTDQKTAKGQRHVAVITPGRMIILVPAPMPNTRSETELAPVKSILSSEKPLQITAISYTKLEAYMKDKTKTKCIPFLGFLLAFAYLGHNVIVFEGHASALEFGVTDSDVLIIDSGMLPFLQENWADIAFKVMKQNSRIFVHDRQSYQLVQIARKKSPPGWQYTAPDGEASYVNVLFTTLGKMRDTNQIVHITSGQSVPNPKEFTTDPEQLEYISILPFKYENLNTEMIIKYIWDISKPTSLFGQLQSTRTFKAKLAESADQAIDVEFQLRLSKTSNGQKQLKIKLVRAG